MPGGNLVLGQVDWDAGECRVIDARGDGPPRGAVMALSRGEPETAGRRGADGPRRARGARAANGSRRPWTPPTAAWWGFCSPPGLAYSPSPDVGPPMLVAARLLSYEWESISARAELRRLAERARDRANTDPVTGLPCARP